jgi:hypothetical protein
MYSYPDWLLITVDVLGSILRFLGMAVFGLGTGWLTLEFFRKGQQAWPLQIAIYLGFLLMAIVLAGALTAAALGAFGIGIGVAILAWGLPKKKKEEKED